MNFWGSRFPISPEDVKFTQDSVAMCFQNDDELNKTCEEIAKGNLSSSAFPDIRVLKIDENYYRYTSLTLMCFFQVN